MPLNNPLAYCSLINLNFLLIYTAHFDKSIILPRGFLIDELRVASYELRVTIYCMSYQLLFAFEMRVTVYCMSYEFLFTYE